MVERSQLEGRLLGLYIHIPFCLSKCTYCDFFSIPSKERVPQAYVDALCNEIREGFYGARCKVDSVYVGGGTPSLLSSFQLRMLFSCIKELVPLTKQPEITIEINPDDLSSQLLAVLEECGVNRISCGIQSLNDNSLTFCKRRANSKTNLSALSLLKNKWKHEYSFDLICGLPEESQESFLEGLKTLVSFKPSHISMYSLTIEEETPLGQAFLQNKFSYNYDFADSLWLSARDFLEKNAYKQYEVSNFCLEGKESKHNLKYWTRADYAGCGCGATGSLYFEGGKALRTTNINNIDLYTSYYLNSKVNRLSSVKPFEIEEISESQGEFEFFMMTLRTLKGFSNLDYLRNFNKQLPLNFQKLFEKWQQKGLAVKRETEEEIFYSLGKDGVIYLNTFLQELL